MIIDPGKMRFRVKLQRLAQQTANELGEMIATSTPETDCDCSTTNDQWEDVAEVWAAIRPLTSTETLRAQATSTDTTHKITIRYRPGLTTAWRIVHSQDCDQVRVFNIKGVIDPDGKRLEHWLDAVETTNG